MEFLTAGNCKGRSCGDNRIRRDPLTSFKFKKVLQMQLEPEIACSRISGKMRMSSEVGSVNFVATRKMRCSFVEILAPHHARTSGLVAVSASGGYVGLSWKRSLSFQPHFLYLRPLYCSFVQHLFTEAQEAHTSRLMECPSCSRYPVLLLASSGLIMSPFSTSLSS